MISKSKTNQLKNLNSLVIRKVSVQIRNANYKLLTLRNFQSQTIPVISDLRYNLTVGLAGGFSA